jgi:hypothetical protein
VQEDPLLRSSQIAVMKCHDSPTYQLYQLPKYQILRKKSHTTSVTIRSKGKIITTFDARLGHKKFLQGIQQQQHCPLKLQKQKSKELEHQ